MTLMSHQVVVLKAIVIAS